jgi:hypothetical protein
MHVPLRLGDNAENRQVSPGSGIKLRPPGHEKTSLFIRYLFDSKSRGCSYSLASGTGIIMARRDCGEPRPSSISTVIGPGTRHGRVGADRARLLRLLRHGALLRRAGCAQRNRCQTLHRAVSAERTGPGAIDSLFLTPGDAVAYALYMMAASPAAPRLFAG